MSDFPATSHPDFWIMVKEQYPEEYAWLTCLVRAFRDNQADYVYVDNRNRLFTFNAATFGNQHGLLSFKEEGSDEEQYTCYCYRLTELGRHILLSPNAHNAYP